jgi:FOG: HEAT repeat
MNKRAYSLVLALGLSCLIAASSPVVAGESITNADIIQMTRAGLTPDVILMAIQTSPNSFDLSTRSVLQLSENGVGDAVLKAMYAAAAGQGVGAQQERFSSELGNVGSSQPEVRDAAVAWFLANKDSVLPELRNNLLNLNAANRAASALILGRMADLQSVGALRNMLTDPSSEVRKNAAQALFNLNDQQAVAAAEQALARRVDPLDGFIRLVGYFKQTKHVDSLGGILSSNPDAANRVAAAWAIGEIGRSAVAGRPALEKALASDTEAPVRCEAAKAIARFNDSAAAASLIEACRIDPSVRMTTLQLLADYPEAVDFLVSVMNLGQDLISVDETEAARASLTRLAGRDLGRDGQAWNEWLAQNRSRFPGTAGGAMTAQAQTNQFDAFGGIPGVPMSGSSGRNEPVDVAAWGIIADSAMIPTVPMAGGVSLSGGSGFTSSSAAATPGAGMSLGGVPSLVPDMDMPDMDVPSSAMSSDQFQASQVVDVAPQPQGSGGRTRLRTWSSDPDRVGGGGGAGGSRQTASADGAVPGWAGAFEPIEESGDSAKQGEIINAATLSSPTHTFSPAPSAASGGFDDAEASAFGSSSSLSSYGITGSSSSSQPELTGISLPIPPIGGTDDDAFSSAPSGFGSSSSPSTSSPSSSSSTFSSSDFFSTSEPAGSTFTTGPVDGQMGEWTTLSPTDTPASTSGDTTVFDAPSDEWSSFPAATADPEAFSGITSGPVDDANGEWMTFSPTDTPALTEGETTVFAAPSDDWPSFPAETGGAESLADPYADWNQSSQGASSGSMPPSLGDSGFPMEDGPMVVSGSMPEVPVGTVPESPATDYDTPQDGTDVFSSELPESPYASMQEGDSLAAQPETTAPDAGVGEDAAFVPAPPISEEQPAYRSDLFVEPEPGQFVITDDNPLGAPYQPQMQAESPVYSAPPVDMTESAAVQGEPMFEAMTDPVVESTPPAATVAAPVDAAPVVTAPGTTTTTATASREVFKSSSPAPEPPPINEPIQPGDTNTNYAASQQLAPPPAESGGNFLVDPSVPLPPVRPEGTISVHDGKNLPLLGEGFF